MQVPAKSQQGFTLVELLIVVAIIGILAAIAIPQFGQYRESAAKAALQSDLRSCLSEFNAEYAEKGDDVLEGKDDEFDCVVGEGDNEVTVKFDVAGEDGADNAENLDGSVDEGEIYFSSLDDDLEFDDCGFNGRKITCDGENDDQNNDEQNEDD